MLFIMSMALSANEQTQYEGLLSCERDDLLAGVRASMLTMMRQEGGYPSGMYGAITAWCAYRKSSECSLVRQRLKELAIERDEAAIREYVRNRLMRIMKDSLEQLRVLEGALAVGTFAPSAWSNFAWERIMQGILREHIEPREIYEGEDAHYWTEVRQRLLKLRETQRRLQFPSFPSLAFPKRFATEHLFRPDQRADVEALMSRSQFVEFL